MGPVQTNCYIAACGRTGEAVVIDPGDDAPLIVNKIASEGLRVPYIFITHGHFDHIMAVGGVKAATGAGVVIHELDASRLTDGKASHVPVGRRGGMVAADRTVRDGDAFSVGDLRFVWLHTPGHTPGSCVIECGDRLYTGDTLFEGDCGRCDLPGGDYGAMLRSLRRLAGLSGDRVVCPGHDVSTTLERERLANADMRRALENP